LNFFVQSEKSEASRESIGRCLISSQDHNEEISNLQKFAQDGSAPIMLAMTQTATHELLIRKLQFRAFLQLIRPYQHAKYIISPITTVCAICSHVASLGLPLRNMDIHELLDGCVRCLDLSYPAPFMS
jgi:hypothetical protein